MTHRIVVLPVVLTLLFTGACGSKEPAPSVAPSASVAAAPSSVTAPHVPNAPMPESPGTDRICTLVGCESGFWLKVPVNLHFEQLRASTVTVCRNALCYSSSLATLAEPSGPDSGNRVTFPDPAQRDTLHTPLIHAEVRRAASGGYQLHVSYSPWASGELRNGDVYDVTLTDKRGRKPLKVHETVSYEVNQPNGPECPSTCLGIEIDKT